ncbi:MAG: hypothetical protein ACKO6A_03905 [Bacteroidota bacterium]
MKLFILSLSAIIFLIIFSCGSKDSTSNSTENSKKVVTKNKDVKVDPTPICKLKMADLIGSYANKSGFSATIKISEKDSTKLDFTFQLSRGCVRRYVGTAIKEEYFSEDEINFKSCDSINKVAIEISMFFTEGKLSIAERTSEKKEKTNDKCIFEGHLTKLK